MCARLIDEQAGDQGAVGTEGVHQLEGDEPFSVVVVSLEEADSYAYLGGSSTGKINPAPQG